MSDRIRLSAVIVEVTDLERSTALYRDGFGVDLHPGDNGVDDRWIGGVHSEIEVVHEPWGRSGRYRDFDGNVIELTEPRPRG